MKKTYKKSLKKGGLYDSIKKKSLALVLALSLCLEIVGCGGNTVVQRDGASLEFQVEQTSDDAETSLNEDGVYTTKEDVALYIHTYGRLPQNFITKKEAKKLGWSGGSLEEYAPGMCIGGDYFGNYEGLLPEDNNYRECDIDTLGKKSRGAKRIIYSDDGYIYYTEDHYESFELLYEP